MKINGAPALDYHLKPAPIQVTYGQAYENEQARLYAGLSIAEWDKMPGTQQWIDPEVGGRSKAEMLILYRMSLQIPAAMNDAQAREMERNANRRGR